MATNGMRPKHPGEVLREDYLKPLGMSGNALAKPLRVPTSRAVQPGLTFGPSGGTFKPSARADPSARKSIDASMAMAKPVARKPRPTKWPARP